MKRVQHEVERLGNDKLKIKALFRDNFKRPAHVAISRSVSEAQTPSEVIHGDVKEVTDIMYSLAEIAWEMGWRPQGLAPVVGMVIQQYKLPKGEL